jgi:hypothetical protein
VDWLLKAKRSVGSLTGMNSTYLNHSKLLLSLKRRQAALYNTALYRETDFIYRLLHSHTHNLMCICILLGTSLFHFKIIMEKIIQLCKVINRGYYIFSLFNPTPLPVTKGSAIKIWRFDTIMNSPWELI